MYGTKKDMPIKTASVQLHDWDCTDSRDIDHHNWCLSANLMNQILLQVSFGLCKAK